MKRHVLFVCILILSGCTGKIYYSDEVEKALERLDETIANKEIIEGQKEYRISRLRAELGKCSSDRDRYATYNDLFEEYFQYNVDSAIFYGSRKIELSRTIGDADLIRDAIVDMAERYTMSGLYDAALDLFGGNDYGWQDDARYLSVLNTVYSDLAKSSIDPALSSRYISLKESCQNALLSSIGEDDISQIFIKTDILLAEDKGREVLELLLPWIEDNDLELDDQGIIYYTIASAYRSLGDLDNAILWYARSAESDLLVPKYEYRSLYELSSILYEKNDIERAYLYITRSVEDANQSNAQQHKHFSYQILPIVSDSYNYHVSQKNKTIFHVLLMSLVMLILLVIMAIVLIRERNRVVIVERQTKESNTRLKLLTEELRTSVNVLKEMNQIKDMYLGQYLSMCSDYIDGLEKYRSSLRKVLKEGGDIACALRSREYMEKALEDFYNQFDATFLDLFPDFISQLNELLQEDMKVTYHSKERILTTELRVLALIRLGVNDSVKIAHFLRRSVSTIYNYRVKMRNSSICDRGEFEERLMQIGR